MAPFSNRGMFTFAVASLLAAQAPLASASFSWLTPPGSASSMSEEAVYTQNSLCIQSSCTNPVFPGISFLGESVLTANDQMDWQCAEIANQPGLFTVAGFCSLVVANYPFAIPVSSDASLTEGKRIQVQERKALDAYVAHISALGLSFWDYTEPWNHDDCIKNVWKMACYTHFPRCNQLEEGRYLRPCANSCGNYLKACQVQCCDEGVQCVFTHTKKTADGQVFEEEGYSDHHGPSPLCTGGSIRTAPSLAGALALALLWCGFTVVGLPRAACL
mmetsp:Transcript_99054/g.171683  ORF Transcript_99054/g.171683 Transcript_99054/m.171683 type:complete len:274 (-) Transcript_99054:25-846(-)